MDKKVRKNMLDDNFRVLSLVTSTKSNCMYGRQGAQSSMEHWWIKNKNKKTNCIHPEQKPEFSKSAPAQKEQQNTTSMKSHPWWRA